MTDDRRHDMNIHHQDNDPQLPHEEQDSGNRDDLPGPSPEALAAMAADLTEGGVAVHEVRAMVVLTVAGVVLAQMEGREFSGTFVDMPDHEVRYLADSIEQARAAGDVDAMATALFVVDKVLNALAIGADPRAMRDRHDNPLWKTVAWLTAATWMEAGLGVDLVSSDDYSAPDDISQLGLGLDGPDDS